MHMVFASHRVISSHRVITSCTSHRATALHKPLHSIGALHRATSLHLCFHSLGQCTAVWQLCVLLQLHSLSLTPSPLLSRSPTRLPIHSLTTITNPTRMQSPPSPPPPPQQQHQHHIHHRYIPTGFTGRNWNLIQIWRIGCQHQTNSEA